MVMNDARPSATTKVLCMMMVLSERNKDLCLIIISQVPPPFLFDFHNPPRLLLLIGFPLCPLDLASVSLSLTTTTGPHWLSFPSSFCLCGGQAVVGGGTGTYWRDKGGRGRESRLA